MRRYTSKNDSGTNELVFQNGLEGDWSISTRRNGTNIVRGAAIDKLSEYEDAEENGRLIMFPCKPGDIVFVIYNNQVFEAKVKRYYHVYGNEWGIELYGIFPEYKLGDFNKKNIFSTRTAAYSVLLGKS